MGGVVNLLTVVALLYVLIKIPFWILGSLRVSSGRSVLGGLARAYVTGRVLGAVLGRSTGRASLAAAGGGWGRGASRRTSDGDGTLEDPPWPVTPQVYWGTPAGNRRLDRARGEIRARHLAGQHQTKPRGRGRGSGVRPPTFQQPAPQTPTHDRASGHATQAPKPTVFQSADGIVSTAAGRPVVPPRPRHRSRAPRRYPPFSEPGAPTARRPVPTPPPPMPAAFVASVPPALRFRPATPPPPIVPVRAAGAPASPVFHSATPEPENGGRRGYTHTAAPVVFQPATGAPVDTSPPVSQAPLPEPPPEPPPASTPQAQAPAPRERRSS